MVMKRLSHLDLFGRGVADVDAQGRRRPEHVSRRCGEADFRELRQVVQVIVVRTCLRQAHMPLRAARCHRQTHLKYAAVLLVKFLGNGVE